jgi:hypothetical protein
MGDPRLPFAAVKGRMLGMPLYKLTSHGEFVPFEEKPFGDLEQKLESWVESNPHLVAGPERFAVFGRQVRTAFGRIVDLLAVDESGAVVVIELKRGETPRQIIAQALEYAAWVDSLGVDELDAVAQRYTSRHGGEAEDLLTVYQRAFANDEEQEDPDSEAAERVTFNHRQRIVLVAEEFTGEVEQTLRYLRSRMGVDIAGVRFGIHESAGELLIETEQLVGREPRVSAVSKTSEPVAAFSDEEIVDRATSPFVKEAVGKIEGWVESLNLPNVELRLGRKTGRAIYLNGKRTARFYYAKEWIYSWLHPYSAAEADEIRTRLSTPDQVVEGQPKEGFIRLHLRTSEDLDVYKEVVLKRLTTG